MSTECVVVSRKRPDTYQIITIQFKKTCIIISILASHLNIILGQFWAKDPSLGDPWDHTGTGPRKRLKNHFLRPSFWDHLETLLYVFATPFFLTISGPLFSCIARPRDIQEDQFRSPEDTKVRHMLAKWRKVKSAFSLERGHQNQAFQGLVSMTIFNLLMHVVEIWTFYIRSKEIFKLYSISGPIWPPFVTPKWQ